MDLYTRCPECSTVFRVTTRHLQASGGKVRCGRCQSVFDGFASLTAKSPVASRVSDEIADDGAVAAAARQAVADETGVSSTSKDKPGQPASTLPNVPVPTLAFAEHLEQEPETNLYEWEFKAAPRNSRAGMWWTLSVIMFMVTLVQAAYIFRSETLVSLPQVRPLYQLACQWLSCEIGLPRLSDELHIDASDLQFIDPEKPNIVQLTALVRNRAPVSVEYPALELTLTNVQEKVVARRVFFPDEYLERNTMVENGLSGKGEVSVNLFMDTGTLRAAGYRLYLFYPV